MLKELDKAEPPSVPCVVLRPTCVPTPLVSPRRVSVETDAYTSTSHHTALPTRIVVASEANVMISQPAVIGKAMAIMVLRRPKMEHMGDDKGALNMATNGTIEPR